MGGPGLAEDACCGFLRHQAAPTVQSGCNAGYAHRWTLVVLTAVGGKATLA